MALGKSKERFVSQKKTFARLMNERDQAIKSMKEEIDKNEILLKNLQAEEENTISDLDEIRFNDITMKKDFYEKRLTYLRHKLAEVKSGYIDGDTALEFHRQVISEYRAINEELTSKAKGLLQELFEVTKEMATAEKDAKELMELCHTTLGALPDNRGWEFTIGVTGANNSKLIALGDHLSRDNTIKAIVGNFI